MHLGLLLSNKVSKKAGNTYNSQDGRIYRELVGNRLLTNQKLKMYLLKAIQLYLQCKNNHNKSTFYQIIKQI